MTGSDVCRVVRMCVPRAGALLFAALILPAAECQAQMRRFEAGVFASVLALNEHPDTDAGGGVRLGVALTRYLALEAELAGFPRSLERIPEMCPGGGQPCIEAPTIPMSTEGIFQGQFGVKAGLRVGRAGFFAKVRPGFVRVRSAIQVMCITAPCPPLRAASTEFSLDVGGVIEFYPVNRLIVRVDGGTTYIRGAGTDLSPFARSLGHTPQFGAGLAVRF